MASDTLQIEGFNVHLVFGQDASIALLLTEVTDSGFDSGDDIDITSNATIGAREKAPAALGEPQDISFTARYDLADRAKLQAIIGVHGAVTVEYRAYKNRLKGYKVVYADAWLRSWTPQAGSIGNMSTLQGVIGIAGGTSDSSAVASAYHPEGTLTEITD